MNSKSVTVLISLAWCFLLSAGRLAAGELPEITVETQSYRADVVYIASEPRNSAVPETPFSHYAAEAEHHDTVMQMCRERLADLGFETGLDAYEYEQEYLFGDMLVSYPAEGVNVIGTLTGQVHPETIVMVSAHYDSVPDCNGADDDGSGVAGVLEIARILVQHTYEHTLVVALWDEEEEGLLGSRHYAKAARARGDDIVAHYVYEMIGYKSDEVRSQKIPVGFFLFYPHETLQIRLNGARGDFIAVIHDDASSAMAADMYAFAQTEMLSLIQMGMGEVMVVGPVRNLLRSDHSPFWDEDYPAMMITDTANFRNRNYHCIGGFEDTADTLDYEFASRVVAVTAMSAMKELKVIE